MKVKNIMFFGFAAAILSAGAASAAPNYTTVTAGAADNKIVTSKSYVDSKDALLNQDIALKQDKIDGSHSGQVVTGTDTAGTVSFTQIDTAVTENSTNLVTSGAVESAIAGAMNDVAGDYQEKSDSLSIGNAEGGWTALDTTITAAGASAPVTSAVYTAVDAKQNKIDGSHNGQVVTGTNTAGTVSFTQIDTAVAQNSDNLVTSGAVYTAVDAKQNKIDGSHNGQVVTGTDTAGTVSFTQIDTTVTQNSTNLVTSGAVESAIAGAMNDVAGDYQEKSDSLSIGNAEGGWTALDTTITAAGASAPVTSAVYTAVDAKQNKIDGSHNGQVVTGTNTAGTVSFTQIDTAVTENSTNLVTSGAVQTAIDGAIADVTYEKDATCTAGVPCALVDDGETKKWYGMAI